MKTAIFIIAFFLISCSYKESKRQEFHRITPDSLRGFYGPQHYKEYLATREFENLINLRSLYYGASHREIRLWNIASSYDPQELFILREYFAYKWYLRIIRYYRSRPDSIQSDYSMQVKPGFIDDLEIDRYWDLPSQSDMNIGDRYGCVDGSTILLEMADTFRYKYALYTCPGINSSKDSVFATIAQLVNKLYNTGF